jgi:hypothetical protein
MCEEPPVRLASGLARVTLLSLALHQMEVKEAQKLAQHLLRALSK